MSWAKLRECRRDKKFSLANVSSNKRSTNLMCARGYRLATLHFLAGIFACLLYSSEAVAPETDPRRLYSAEPRHFYRRRDVSVMSAIKERVERTASSPLVSEVSLRDHPLFACFITLYTMLLYPPESLSYLSFVFLSLYDLPRPFSMSVRRAVEGRGLLKKRKENDKYR